MEDRTSIAKEKCGRRSEAFGSNFGGKRVSTLSLPTHRHDIYMTQKIHVTEGLKASGGSLTTTAQTILSMATFILSSLIPPNV
jgi:hypothetical protein